MARPETTRRRRPGRPRSKEADAAILAAALDLLIERGAGETSIEQVAQRAGVTRATVYRRFKDKADMLVQAIESMRDDHDPEGLDWPDVESMVSAWADYLSHPRQRRMVRRLYAAVDDYPELREAYWNTHGRHRSSAVDSTLERAREDGQLPADTDVEILQQMLTGALLHHLGAHPDADSAQDIKSYLIAVLRQAGYQPTPSPSATRLGGSQ